MAQVVNPDLVRNLQAYFKGLGDSPINRVSTANVSNPPTDAELDAAFDTPANLPDGWMGVVNDNNAGTALWLVTAVGGSWWYEGLTKAT